MQSRVKIVLVLVLVAAISFAGAGMLFARDGRETIEVFYRNIKLKVQGVDVPVTADNEPFIYQGRTYVPLRVVSEALGYNVEWDGATSTVLIGDAPGDVFLSELKPYKVEGLSYRSTIRYDAEANMVMDGQRYHNGMKFTHHTTGGVAHRATKLFFASGAEYSRLTGLVGLDDKIRYAPVTVSFYGDERLLAAVDLDPQGLPRPTPVDIDVSGVLVLRIESIRTDPGGGGWDQDVNLANMALIK